MKCSLHSVLYTECRNKEHIFQLDQRAIQAEYPKTEGYFRRILYEEKVKMNNAIIEIEQILIKLPEM